MALFNSAATTSILITSITDVLMHTCTHKYTLTIQKDMLCSCTRGTPQYFHLLDMYLLNSSLSMQCVCVFLIWLLVCMCLMNTCVLIL